ncbi:MAG TPA: diguanylate cyclase [Conexibacter sp.]|nr:diguanylate cyclase [Conexibacter sp.]
MLQPLPGAHVTTALAALRLAPFALCGVVAFALVPVSGGVDVDWAMVAAAFALSCALGGVALLAPRLTDGDYADGAILALVAIALLRGGTGGARGGYGVLVIVPVLWVALYGSRAQLWRVLVAAALAFAIPLVAIGAPDYPPTGWRSAPLTLLCAGIVGVVVQELLARERAGAERLKIAHDRSAAILGAMREGFALTRDGTIIDVNPALCELTGFTREQLVGARVPFPFWPPDHLEQMQALRRRVRADRGGSFEAVFQRADGSRFTAEVAAVPVPEEGGGPIAFLNTMRDVTERNAADNALRERSEQLHAAHAELERLVRTDPLTGLPNRRALEETYARELASAQRGGGPLTLAMIDLDHFKAFNDAYGHPAGDALLAAVSRNWTRRLRVTDALARWGGEEFCLLLPGCDAARACALVEQLRDGVPHEQTFSAGVAVWERGMTREALLAQADAALYRAKRDGRDRTAVAAPSAAA